MFKTRIHVIIVRSSGHHIIEYNPPENIQHEMELWLIYLDLEHTRHYLSTTMSPNAVPSIPHPTTRVAGGNSARTRRATGSTEPLNDPTSVVGSSSRTADSIPAVQIADLTPPISPMQNPSASQGTLHYSQPVLEDIFANIQHVQGDFVHRLIQNGALKFIQQTYNAGTSWTPRDCRIQRTSPNADSY